MIRDFKKPVSFVAMACWYFVLPAAACRAEPLAPDRMYEPSSREPAVLQGSHHVVFQGKADSAGYNNHAYLARFDDRFWAVWSCSARDGGHAGQHVRWSSSIDGIQWTESTPVAVPLEDEYLIARGLWVRNDELLALSARCSGEGPETTVKTLEAYAWNKADSTWSFRGVLGEEIINNYPPLLLPSGEWLVPYRHRELDRVDGVMIGGATALDAWRRIPFPGSEQARVSEANAIIRSDATLAVHFRDNERSGFLFRSVSVDGGRTFAAPTVTDFPDCKCKHYCLRLTNGLYVLVNNPQSRKVLQLAVSSDGIVFRRSAVVRRNPPPVRNPGHDKSPSFTYPHALEYEGRLWIAYAENRDDIVITNIAVRDIEKLADDIR